MTPVATPPLLLQEIRERRTFLQSPPDTLNIEFSDVCHMDPPCTYCVGKNKDGYRERGHVSDAQLARYWPSFLRARRVNDCTYGELQLYPGHQRVIERLSAAGVRFGFTTTGQLLTANRARFLITHAATVEFAVSLNAATPDTYRKYHGDGFSTVLRNLRRFVELHGELRPGQPLPVSLSYIVMRGNLHEVFPFLELASALGVSRLALRHLFDFRAGQYQVNSFGYLFDYERERLQYSEYLRLRTQIEDTPAFSHLNIHFEWKPEQSFIQEQAEPGVDIPCLFPWKFLSIRPLHDSYTPCCFLKRSIALPSQSTLEEVWNGEVMVGMRTELAAGLIPRFCRTYGDACPLVLASFRNELHRPVLYQIGAGS